MASCCLAVHKYIDIIKSIQRGGGEEKKIQKTGYSLFSYSLITKGRGKGK